MEIAILILLSIVALLLIAVLALQMRKGKGNVGGSEDALRGWKEDLIRSQAETKAELDHLNQSITDKVEGKIDAKLQAQMVEIVKTMQIQSNQENERMNAFQQTVNTNLNQQVKAINDTIASRFSDITSKNAEQMSATQKSMRELMDSDTRRLNEFQATIRESMTSQMNAMNQKMDASIQAINAKVNQSLENGFKGTSESMASLQKQLGMVQEAQKSIDGLQTQITSLKDVLSNNQQRGKYGELQLEMLLDNLFQGSEGTLYDTQYILESAHGDEPQKKPDAVVFLDGEAHHQMVCIDSKFSLTGYDALFDSSLNLSDAEIAKEKSAFHAATKQRIDETSKYIIPGKTISNAIMFIPNDGVFAFLHNEFPDLIEYAQKKSVVLVSPTILQPLLASFRVIQIDAKKSKSIAAINEHLNALGREFGKFIPRWKSLNDGIQNLTRKSGQFDITVQKIGKRFDRAQGIDFQEENDVTPLPDSPAQIEKGDLEEEPEEDGER